VLLADDARELSEDLPARTAASLVARLGAAHGRLRQQGHTERVLIKRVHGFTGDRGGPVVEIPRLEREVHDLDGLLEVGRHLFE
jgi:hypothetical protein